MLIEGLAELCNLEPERGVLLVSNHRSFFDQYAALMAVWTYPARWGRSLNFPVRSEFFYDKPTGLFLNYFVAAGAMYPPIYRDTTRQVLNARSLDNEGSRRDPFRHTWPVASRFAFLQLRR